MVSLPLRTPLMDVTSLAKALRSPSLPSQMRISMHLSWSRCMWTDVLTSDWWSCCRSVSLSPTELMVWSYTMTMVPTIHSSSFFHSFSARESRTRSRMASDLLTYPFLEIDSSKAFRSSGSRDTPMRVTPSMVV